MGHVYGDFTLRNARKRGLPSKVVRAMVDTGANTLCLPPALAQEPQLDEVEKRQVKRADGGRHWVPYVGPVQIPFAGRHSFGGAFVMGGEVLIGAIALQDLDLIVVPALETVTVHPDSPGGGARFCLQSEDLAGPAAVSDLKASLGPVLSGA